MFGGKAPDALPESCHIRWRPYSARMWRTGAFAVRSMQERYASIVALFRATRRCDRCRITASTVSLSDQSVCRGCLRSIDADPAGKRRVLFSYDLTYDA